MAASGHFRVRRWALPIGRYRHFHVHQWAVFMSADKCVPYVRPAGLKVDWFNPVSRTIVFRSSPAVSTGRWSATRAICGLTVHSAGGIRPSNNGMARFQFLQRNASIVCRTSRSFPHNELPGQAAEELLERNRCDALRMTEYTN